MRSETLLRFRRRPVVTGLVWRTALAAAALACGDSLTEPAIPVEPAGIAGRVTSIVPTGNFSGRVLVEAVPGQPNVGAKVLVTVTGETNVFVPRSGDRPGFVAAGQFRTLATGQWVRVWFGGPLADSYPQQGVASNIAVDSLGVSISQSRVTGR